MIVAEVVGVKRIPLLGKGGVDAPSRNIPVPLKGADGVVRSNSKTISLERTTPSAPAKVASRLFLWAQPPLLCQGGDLTFNPTFGNNEMRILRRALCPRWVL